MTRLNLFQSGFHVSLVGDPTNTAGAPDDRITIDRVTTTEMMGRYLEAYVEGWGIPEKDRDQFKINVRPWLEQPGWSLYLARLDGQPAAAATLYVDASVGYLADATTNPAFRRRGLQSALLRRRIRDAAAAGADVVFSGAAPFSESHRNMARAGMWTQFIRSLWTPL
jgi:hypothetical protein